MLHTYPHLNIGNNETTRFKIGLQIEEEEEIDLETFVFPNIVTTNDELIFRLDNKNFKLSGILLYSFLNKIIDAICATVFAESFANYKVPYNSRYTNIDLHGNNHLYLEHYEDMLLISVFSGASKQTMKEIDYSGQITASKQNDLTNQLDEINKNLDEAKTALDKHHLFSIAITPYAFAEAFIEGIAPVKQYLRMDRAGKILDNYLKLNTKRFIDWFKVYKGETINFKNIPSNDYCVFHQLFTFDKVSEELHFKIYLGNDDEGSKRVTFQLGDKKHYISLNNIFENYYRLLKETNYLLNSLPTDKDILTSKNYGFTSEFYYEGSPDANYFYCHINIITKEITCLLFNDYADYEFMEEIEYDDNLIFYEYQFDNDDIIENLQKNCVFAFKTTPHYFAKSINNLSEEIEQNYTKEQFIRYCMWSKEYPTEQAEALRKWLKQNK